MVVDTKPQEKKLPVHKSIYLLPNLITSLSMFMGFLSMVWAVQSRFEEAGLAIVLSALLDGMDGKVARLTHTASEFGVQYDSLADLIAFGLAPAFLLWQWQLEGLGRFGVVVAFLKNLLFAVLHGTSSAYVGELFNFLMGSVFAFSAGFVYRRNKSRRGALLGAAIGTKIALLINEDILKIMMLVALPCAAILLMLKKDFGKENDSPAREYTPQQEMTRAALIGLGLGCYDGLIGPGTGTFMIMAFTMALSMDLLTASGCAKIANLCSNVASAVLFIISGKVWYIVSQF